MISMISFQSIFNVGSGVGLLRILSTAPKAFGREVARRSKSELCDKKTAAHKPLS